MTVVELIASLQEHVDSGDGDLKVFAVVSSSGVAHSLQHAFLRGPEDCGDAGPWESGPWIEVCADHA